MRRALALHCALASGAAWRGVAAQLPDWEMVCPDLPGHGRAPDWDAAQDFQTQALDLVLAAVGEGPMHVVGHSFGATLALRLLVERPGMVRSLALVEPVMFAAANRDALSDYRADMVSFGQAMAEGRAEDAARLFHGVWGGNRRFDTLPESARDAMTGRIGLIEAQEPSIVTDVHGILSRLPVADVPPVLIVTRKRPTGIVAAIAEGLSDRMPKARMAELGRGHMIPMEEPEALAALLRDHWAASAVAGER